MNQTFEQFLEKIEEYKEKNGADLSRAEDLSLAVMNLISLEEHFFFTGNKTGKTKYFDMVEDIRNVRKDLMKQLIDVHEGETWCISKHLLAATMRIMEVGTKLQNEGKKEESYEMFRKAYKVYSIFWGIKLNLISTSDIGTEARDASSLEDLVTKLADCCKE